jgi:hypothetical protein
MNLDGGASSSLWLRGRYLRSLDNVAGRADQALYQ